MPPLPPSNHADQILPRLWLGNSRAAADDEWLRATGITAVFNCTKNLPFSTVPPVQWRVPVDDNLEPEEIRNFELWAPELTLRLMGEYKAGHTILVHCMAGMQRSAAAVACFLIAWHMMPPETAMQYIRSRRPVAFFPSANFGSAIHGFARRFLGEILPAIQNARPKTE